MELHVVRLWVPDRPGALGLVASRIGAVRGDVVGIEILERGAGRAVDELIVGLPEAGLVELLVRELQQVDGVSVEDVRPLPAERHDPGVAALGIAADLVEAEPAAVLPLLCQEVVREFDADWTAAVAGTPPAVVASTGEAPAAAWLAAFVEGSSHLPGGHEHDGAPHDVAWATLGRTGSVLAAGRKGRPFRWRERRQLTLLARVADAALDGRADPVRGV
jgi:hypothetical protein